MKMPNRTRATVFPISVVPINAEGFFKNLDIMMPHVWPRLPCSSICNLLDDKKAISIPEKKKENTRDAKMKGKRPVSMSYFFLRIRYKKKKTTDSITAQ